MPQLYVYADTYADSLADLQETVAMLRDDIITGSQAATLVLALEPLLPCSIKVGVRTPLSIVYCEAAGRRFRIGQRGQFIAGSWRAKLKSKSFW